jgi:hypothetical protein
MTAEGIGEETILFRIRRAVFAGSQYDDGAEPGAAVVADGTNEVRTLVIPAGALERQDA